MMMMMMMILVTILYKSVFIISIVFPWVCARKTLQIKAPTPIFATQRSILRWRMGKATAVWALDWRLERFLGMGQDHVYLSIFLIDVRMIWLELSPLSPLLGMMIQSWTGDEVQPAGRALKRTGESRSVFGAHQVTRNQGFVQTSVRYHHEMSMIDW